MFDWNLAQLDAGINTVLQLYAPAFDAGLRKPDTV